MISRLTGLVIDREPEGACVVDVGGVGYEVFVPLRSRLPDPPDPATLYVHTHVREEAFTLYGFGDADDRLAFRALLGISNVGPKLALAILSQLSASEIAQAVARGDKARFKGISGVGAKTVERLVLELKDKLPMHLVAARAHVTSGGTVVAPAPAAGQTPQREAVINALVQLGYRRGEAETAAGKLPEESLAEPVENLLRRALSFLA